MSCFNIKKEKIIKTRLKYKKIIRLLAVDIPSLLTLLNDYQPVLYEIVCYIRMILYYYMRIHFSTCLWAKTELQSESEHFLIERNIIKSEKKFLWMFFLHAFYNPRI